MFKNESSERLNSGSKMVDFTPAFLETFQCMNVERNRLKSFTSKWPHKGTSNCSPDKVLETKNLIKLLAVMK